MSSEYGARSLNDLKSKAREQLRTAETAVPCVTVTDANWKALITSQRTQIEWLAQLQATLEMIATKEEVDRMNDTLIANLKSYTDLSRMTTEEFQKAIQCSASAAEHQLVESVKAMERQAGSMRENASNSLSVERERMNRYTKKLFWISMTPSVIILMHYLIPLISSLVSPGS